MDFVCVCFFSPPEYSITHTHITVTNWQLRWGEQKKNRHHSFQQKHPHVIFEARTKANKGCANTGALERRKGVRRQKHIAGFHGDPGLVEEQHPNGAGRYKRDVREATKYIETAIVVDKAMFEKRNGSTRSDVVHDAIQVANIADLVSKMRPLK